MATNLHPVSEAARPTTIVPESRPFAWLQPAYEAELSDDALAGLDDLRLGVEDSIGLLARAFVDYSFRLGRTLDLASRRPGPTTSVLNRRRRAARLWINAILDGTCDVKTLRDLACIWLPQLAGTGPEPRDAVAKGWAFVEYLRGAFTAAILSDADANLVPHARALNALDGILAVHLRAMEFAAES